MPRYALFPLLALTLTLPTYAQQERWYQVELLVFSREGSNAARSEQWPATPRLSYPGATRFLVEPARVEANLAANPGGESEVDVFGRQFINFPEPQQAGEFAAAQQPPAPAAEEAPAQEATARQAALPATPTPFVTLPRSAREFDGKAAYMQRTGKYRTLFHHSWLQPVVDERNALPIVLDRSGDSGDWPRLQGSIKLYLSRYLHLETNLWLNTDGSYLPGEWRMPAPPLGPVSLLVAERTTVGQAEAAPGSDASEPGGVFSAERLPPGQEVAEEAEPEPVYGFRHAVLMQQKRRMRSKEVHYLDHPMLGVVVRLNPVDEDYLRALAAAEFGSEPLPQPTDQAP